MSLENNQLTVRIDDVMITLMLITIGAGVAAIGSFVVPDMAMSTIGEEGILVASLIFVGGLLTTIAIAPDEEDSESFQSDSERVVRLLPATDGAVLDRIDRTVFGVGAGLSLLFVVALLVVPSAMGTAVSTVNDFLLGNLGFVYLAAMLVCVAFCIGIAASSRGTIRLGGEDAEPRFSLPTYTAILFSAGIAAGIVFWGPAEAIYHFNTVPPLVGAEAGTSGAAVGALQYTLFHWGFSAWSAYVVFAVPIAYFAYNKGAPLRVSTVLAPFLGLDNLDSPVAKAVDVMAVFATIGGLATSLGFVGNQLLTGVEYQWGVELGTVGILLVIGVLATVFTVAVVTGLVKGIKRLAILNVGMFGIFGVGLLLVGPTGYIATTGVQAVGGYLAGFLPMSVHNSGWAAAWTLFYWAWWFSWAPFVGLFLARISKGRTIREVVVSGMAVTSLVTMVWFLIVGGTALRFQSAGRADILAAVGEFGVAVSGYPLFGALPLGTVFTFAFIALIVTFFVTSATASTLSLSMLTSRDDRDPSTSNRVFWGSVQAVIGAVMIVVGGASTLQSAAIITGGPFAIVGVVAVAGLVMELFGGGSGETEPTPQPSPETDD